MVTFFLFVIFNLSFRFFYQSIKAAYVGWLHDLALFGCCPSLEVACKQAYLWVTCASYTKSESASEAIPRGGISCFRTHLRGFAACAYYPNVNLLVGYPRRHARIVYPNGAHTNGATLRRVLDIYWFLRCCLQYIIRGEQLTLY